MVNMDLINIIYDLVFTISYIGMKTKAFNFVSPYGDEMSQKLLVYQASHIAKDDNNLSAHFSM